MTGDFEPEQKRYLEGFVAGMQIARTAGGLARNGAGGAPASAPAAGPGGGEPGGPRAPHLRAQDRFLKSGAKLSDQEKFKRDLHPFDGYEKLKAQARNNEPPKPDD